MPVRKSDFASLHNLWNFTKSNSANLQIIHLAMALRWPLRSLQSFFQAPISGAPPTSLTLGIHRDVGLAGRAAVSIVSVTCPARQPAAPPVIRLGFILRLKILDSIWLSADQRASLSPDKPQPIFLAVSQSRPKPNEFVCKSLFRSAAVKLLQYIYKSVSVCQS